MFCYSKNINQQALPRNLTRILMVYSPPHEKSIPNAPGIYTYKKQQKKMYNYFNKSFIIHKYKIKSI